jgi:hypothetical protein
MTKACSIVTALVLSGTPRIAQPQNLIFPALSWTSANLRLPPVGRQRFSTAQEFWGTLPPSRDSGREA